MKIEMCDEFFYRIKDKNLYQSFNTCKDNVLRNNQNINFYSGEWVKIKINDYITHRVKPAETISEIAKNYSISEDEIIEFNKLKSKKLFIGQMLKISIKTPT